MSLEMLSMSITIGLGILIGNFAMLLVNIIIVYITNQYKGGYDDEQKW